MATGAGSISLLIDSPLQTLARSLRAVGPEMSSEIQAHTRAEAQPIWFEETRARAATHLQQRVLVSTARTGTKDRSLVLRAGGDTLKGGRSAERITRAAEFAGGDTKVITSRTKTGTTYQRKLGGTFGPRYRNGAVVYPSAREAIPRLASLSVQTARRTIHEAIENGTA